MILSEGCPPPFAFDPKQVNFRILEKGKAVFYNLQVTKAINFLVYPFVK